MWHRRTRIILLATFRFCSAVVALNQHNLQTQQSRRQLLSKAMAGGVLANVLVPLEPVGAKEDCYKDCFKNCRSIVPNDTSNYCDDNCRDYCAQTDRTDGLSGSVSAATGEVGILGVLP
ncbi:hypothetical protein ACA910_011297 [Epithemia clementina (nom. ined.)]